ncbi:MAG: hypothetical protein ACHQD9_06630 [Chitinophagales bacterium]
MENFTNSSIQKSNKLSAGLEFSAIKKQVQLVIYVLAISLFISVFLAAFGSPSRFVYSANKNSLVDSKMNPESFFLNAFLDKNVSDLLGETASIHFYLPYAVRSADISVSNANGNMIKSFELDSRGEGQLRIHGNELPSGTYRCSLIVDEKIVDSISWILIR